MSRHGWLYLSSALFHALTHCFVSVPWQTERYYGYDGPWQAVTVNIGGFMNGTPPQNQWTSVDLLPGGAFDTYIISNAYCSNLSAVVPSSSRVSGACEDGDSWNPGSSQTQSGARISWQPSLDYRAMYGPFLSGSIYAQNLDVSSQDPSLTVQNSITIGNLTLPDGTGVPLEIGYLALGASSQTQVFSESSINASLPGIVTWNIPGALYNQSNITSFTYGLHIGSVAYSYPGSLVFGGFDQGRAIGPATTFGNSDPTLLDILIDVETGASPFTSGSQGGLLLGPGGNHTSLPASPDPITSYLNLPKETCDNLATLLPIRFDPSSGFYLWEVMDPMYEIITLSPAYLGFVFPPGAGATENVMIKVPFGLLNLQLAPPAVPSAVAYFPCMPYSPPSGSSYALGRAFLQAAFVATNWDLQLSWLAQAPGPGPLKQGLGVSVVDVQDDAQTLDLHVDATLFNASWSDIWIPLVFNASGHVTLPGNTTAISVSGSSAASSGLSTGAKAGIAVGATFGAAIIIACIIGMTACLRRRRRASPAAPYAGPGAISAATSWREAKELPSSDLQAYPMSYELSAQQEPRELDGILEIG